MIIDSHHHYWNYNPEEFDWIDDSMAKIRANFLPKDLKQTITEAGVDGVITVQARQLIQETDWLLTMAANNDFMKGVVGWVPLVQSDIESYLEKYSENTKFKGVRHVVQGEPDPAFILRDDFNRGIKLLNRYSLIYDILILERQLPQTIQFVDAHPNQPFVLDHVAKPLIGQKLLSPWRENIMELAKREHVSCKISGMVTEADFNHWTPELLQPYLEIVLEAFGPDRLLFGSDWPVCLVATSYSYWIECIKKFIEPLSETEQTKILGGNAIRIYDLSCDIQSSHETMIQK